MCRKETSDVVRIQLPRRLRPAFPMKTRAVLVRLTLASAAGAQTKCARSALPNTTPDCSKHR